MEDRSLLASVGYQLHVVAPDAPASNPDLTSVNVGDSYDLVVTVQDLRTPTDSFPGVFAGYLDIGYDASKTHVQVAEVQRIRISPYAGANSSFALTFGDDTTAAIPFNSNTAILTSSVQTALAALPSIGAGNIAVATDITSNDTEIVLQSRFVGKFFGHDVPNLVAASQNMTPGASLSVTYEGDLQNGRSAFAFSEAWRSRSSPTYFPNGVHAADLPDLIDDVGAFAGITPTGTAPLELVRARFVATASGTVAFTPDVSSIQFPAYYTLLYDQDTPVAAADIDLGTPKTLTIGPGTIGAGTIVANDDRAIIREDLASIIDVLENDTTLPATDQTKNIVSVTQPVHGAVTYTATRVVYTPDPNFSGSDTFTYSARNTSGGASSATSTATVFVTVNPVNDAPSFTKGSDQETNDEAREVTVRGWATNVSAGPADEAGQTLSFVVTTDNKDLFSAPPSIDAAGNLHYTPALDAEGSALVTVVLHDSGGTERDGVDVSAAQTFVIHVAKLHPMHHSADPLDTSGDDRVTARDALDCIDHLNTSGAGKVSDNPQPGERYLDVNADGSLTAADPLTVINYLNASGPRDTPPPPPPAEGEGESAPSPSQSTDLLFASPLPNSGAQPPSSSDSANLIALLAADTWQARRRNRL